MAIKNYLKTRVQTLNPTFDRAPSPLFLLKLLSLKQWLFFLVAFIAWAWDAFDFFSVSLVLPELSKTFAKSTDDISWGLTLSLMCRSVGAAIFGIASDRVGRKWPFIVNNVLLIIFELATGFCQSYEQFLACRALFGIAMGGLYGNAAATALEDCPQTSRGIISGMLQSGYPFGYLLATVFARALVNTTKYGWRSLFFFGAGPPLLIILFRLLLPETDAYIDRLAFRNGMESMGNLVAEAKEAIKRHWMLLIYLVVLMAGFNCISHGSQDIFSKMLSDRYGHSSNEFTLVQVVANIGALLGGIGLGYCSQIVGRRFGIVSICIIGGALLYPYAYISGPGLYAAAFFEQFCVQGAWGIIPIHLIELSPTPFRAFVVGTSYQLGNLISSPTAVIEAHIGHNSSQLSIIQDGVSATSHAYGQAIAIVTGSAYIWIIIFTALGPERKGRGMVNDEDENEDGNEGDLYMAGDQEMDHGKW